MSGGDQNPECVCGARYDDHTLDASSFDGLGHRWIPNQCDIFCERRHGGQPVTDGRRVGDGFIDASKIDWSARPEPETAKCSGCSRLATDFLWFHDEPKEQFCTVCCRRALKFGLRAANEAEAKRAAMGEKS